ncbi:hypothetical protein FO440_05235 [Mucilaginibacter corticis]|uniref:Uncharacterized protein n=1 Tax=Mucilaginibacter corticis TaxID=2597670 RepID=A0A556MUI2_9SPHI|nr:hypothetical protein [Mucilaginibacter corticis]TSJ43596.1 hypothetical protein FO440_05235 [Mucilaginibacter corticis]
MTRKALFVIAILPLFISACGMMQSIVKSTFPYTANITIPKTSVTDKSYAAVSLATSFDQNFSKSGNNGDRVSEVSLISAKLVSEEPARYNIGNIKSIRIYLSAEDGNDEILVATRSDITADVGNTLVLDVDNSTFLDKLVRQPNIRIKMVYELRKNIDTDVSLHLVLSLNAYPAGRK